MEYITPEIEIIEFETEDIINMSNVGEGDGDSIQNYPNTVNIN